MIEGLEDGDAVRGLEGLPPEHLVHPDVRNAHDSDAEKALDLIQPLLDERDIRDVVVVNGDNPIEARLPKAQPTGQ